MVRNVFLAIALSMAITGYVFGQSSEDAGLRGSTNVRVPRTLVEQRIDRQQRGRPVETDRNAGDNFAPPPDPFDDFTSDDGTGTAADRSDVFRDLNQSDPSGRQTPQGEVDTRENPPRPRISPNRRTARTAPSEPPLPATGTLATDTLTAEELARTPRPPQEQPRTFEEEPAADEAFAEQEATYAPVGLRVGTFTFLPSLTLTGGYTDNVQTTIDGDPGPFYRLRPALIMRSDWARHQVSGTFNGDFQGFPNHSEFDNPAANAQLDARLDVGRATTVDLQATYDLSRETTSSSNLTLSDTEGVLNQGFGVSAAVTRAVGLAAISLRGSAERDLFGAGDGGFSSDGSGAFVTPSEDRSNTQVLGTLRLSLEAESQLRPYVEVTGGRRNFDGSSDSLGFRRDANIGELRAGLVVDMGSKLSIDTNVGYRREDVEDARLKDLQGVVFDSSAVWSPDRLTLVTLTGTTNFDTTTINGATGSITHGGILSLRRSLRSNLTLDASLGLSYERFVGFSRRDLQTDGSLALTYDLNRNLALTAEYNYERVDSTAVSGDYSANSIEFGVRLQK